MSQGEIKNVPYETAEEDFSMEPKSTHPIRLSTESPSDLPRNLSKALSLNHTLMRAVYLHLFFPSALNIDVIFSHFTLGPLSLSGHTQSFKSPS